MSDTILWASVFVDDWVLRICDWVSRDKLCMILVYTKNKFDFVLWASLIIKISDSVF